MMFEHSNPLAGKSEHDPNVSVRVTTDEEDYCLELTFYGHTFPMHTRTAVDLHHKLGLAILDWFGDTAKWITENAHILNEVLGDEDDD